MAEEAAEDNDEEIEREMGEAEVERMREKYRPKKNNYQDFLQQDSEDIARQYIERERMERTNRREAANQVPTLKDPKLFSVKCFIGAEREMALCLGNKYSELKGTEDEIRIISVNALDKIQGSIYVEALNKYDVEKACEGFNKLKTRYINVKII